MSCPRALAVGFSYHKPKEKMQFSTQRICEIISGVATYPQSEATKCKIKEETENWMRQRQERLIIQNREKNL
ncbi:hypothetical protein AVEN_71073-1 [Araneus ventricosus]|uniref:Uncharacterized protein n=1 Tax=Araneus ventricosus TaxID=182803 RepID=A0A4Y2SVI2_ARAVE|nr:hypothetical protein AVEN_71073-1 [Araneus ventricosus]